MTRILREGMALPFFAQVKVHYRFFSLSFPLWLFTPTLISFSSFFFCLWDKVAESMDLVLFFSLFRWQVSPPIALRTWPHCPLQYRFSPPSWISCFKFLFCAIYLVLHFSDWSNNTESKVNVDTLSFFPSSQSPPPPSLLAAYNSRSFICPFLSSLVQMIIYFSVGIHVHPSLRKGTLQPFQREKSR